ncbi:MAG TPA: cyanophycin synthetase [Thermoanaerobaculia bacterium]|nr:cyanophycin synthetase [Thermoanaerobaculia bacterium]
MAPERIRLLETLVLSGPNYWSYRPCVWMRIDIGGFEERPTSAMDGFYERLVRLLPSLEEHECSEGRKGGFLSRVQEGTWIGHVAEHVAIELQNRIGIPVTFGRTRATKERGVYNLVYEMEEERVGIRAGKLALDVVEACANGDLEDLELEDRLDALKRLREKSALGPSTKAIVDVAVARGIPYLRLNDKSFVQLGTGALQKRIQATIASTTGHLGVEIAGDKDLTKRLLGDHGVPVPKGFVAADEEDAVEIAEKLGWPVVVKPLDASHGRGILTNINSEDELRLAYADALEFRDEVIVERFLEGSDFRFVVVAGKFICAAQRIPAFVVGDGRRTIEDLVAETNKDPRRGIGHEKVLTKIEIDDPTLALLARKKLSPKSVPEKGETVFLKATANLSTGGVARDVTDLVHPSNIHMVERIAGIVGLDIIGIDVVSPTVEKPIGDVGGGVVEVNAAPGFRMHTNPAEGTPRDVAGAVVDMLYPPGTPSRIPIVSVTGTNGKTTTTRLIAHIARYAGHHVGLTTTEGVYVDSETIVKGDCTGPASAKAVLRDPTVTFAALETARGGLIRFGLGYDWANVGVVTNVAADHLGLRDIDTLEDLAKVKALVVERVFPDGVAVLNAEDEFAPWMAERTKAKVALFSLDPANELFKKHVEAGGLGAVMDRHDTLSLYRATLRIPLVHARQIPITFDGRARFNIANALAAALATFAAGLQIDAIRGGLTTFHPSPFQAPGRANVYEFREFKVMVDYCHNPHAMATVAPFLSSMKRNRLIGVLNAPGDRREEDFDQIGKLAAPHFDYVILRDDEDLRGRAAGEVAGKIRDALVKYGLAADSIELAKNETDAVRRALTLAKRDDFVAVFADRISKVAAQIDFERQKEGRGAEPRPS